MAHVDRVALGAATVIRKYYLDINTGTHASPTWTPVNGVSEFKPTLAATMQDDSDWAGAGGLSSVKTAEQWGLEFKLQRKVKATDAAAYDVGQEAIRTAADALLGSNVVEVRWYEVTTSGPTSECYQGYAAVEWNPDGGGLAALDQVAVKLIGRGLRTAATHPDAAGAVPTVTSISPATGPAAGGTLVEIHGTGFFAAGVDDIVASTGIKFGGSGGTAATSWITESDNVVFAVTPAHAAGTVAVVVYNSNGISTVTSNFVYTE